VEVEAGRMRLLLLLLQAVPADAQKATELNPNLLVSECQRPYFGRELKKKWKWKC
jgi:hypothetical protein